ncbi:MAG: segregation/condensation protein A [Sporomusaceae bacterium]|nr:segregation/condensation protein A [Sporomusaceae bacterium]
MEYNLRLDAFEGPLDLLMHLIEKNQIDIYDIPIAQVTEQYLAYIASWTEFDMEIASEFLVMAATLLQIKSRMLLPKPPKVELDVEEDPRAELVNRLVEYRQFKEVAAKMGELYKERALCFTREPAEFARIYQPLCGLEVNELIKAFLAVWESTVPEITLVDHEEVSVQSKMADILQLLTRSKGRLEFKATFIRSGSRQELVASFLAILELLRLKRIHIEQQGLFGPIYLTARE